jgi:hypothetical protein
MIRVKRSADKACLSNVYPKNVLKLAKLGEDFLFLASYGGCRLSGLRFAVASMSFCNVFALM